jgi:hypothetical protein
MENTKSSHSPEMTLEQESPNSAFDSDQHAARFSSDTNKLYPSLSQKTLKKIPNSSCIYDDQNTVLYAQNE